MNPSASMLNAVSRIVIQKVLSSDVIRHIPASTMDVLNRAFLSESPEKEKILVQFRINPNPASGTANSYYDNIANMSIAWLAGDESKDPDGNVWVPYRLHVNSDIQASYGSSPEDFLRRAECISSVASLTAELTTLVSEALLVMTLDSESAAVRDKKNKYNDDCELLRRILSGRLYSIKKGLRAGGKSRAFRQEIFEDALKPSISFDPGEYEIISLDGPKFRPELKTRKYIVRIPSQKGAPCTVRRVL
jgi:hypothetical protein